MDLTLYEFFNGFPGVDAELLDHASALSYQYDLLSLPGNDDLRLDDCEG